MSLLASTAFDDCCWLSAARAATCSWTLVGERGRAFTVGRSTMVIGRPGVIGTSSGIRLDESTRGMTLPTGFSCTKDLLESTRVITSGLGAPNGFAGLGGLAGLNDAEEATGSAGVSGCFADMLAEVGAFLLGPRARFLVMCVS